MWQWWKWRKKRRFTSISVSLTGAAWTWEAQQTERARAQQILYHLEDHRMFYDPFQSERFDGVVESAERLRVFLLEYIPPCESEELQDGLREIQAALREFLTHAPPAPGDWGALQTMRTRVGTAAKRIADAFHVRVTGDLARIVQQSRPGCGSP